MAEDVVKRRGLRKKHAAIDYEVWQWKTKLEQERGTRRVTKAEVQAYAMQAYKNIGIDTFKASDGWYRRWRIRWAKQGFVKPKDNKEDGCKKINDLECNTKNTSSDKNKSRNKPMKYNDDLKSSLTSLKDESSENNLNKGSEVYHLENKTDNELNNYDFPTTLGLLHVENITKNEQSGTDKTLSTDKDLLEIHSEADVLQSKSKVHNYLKDMTFDECNPRNKKIDVPEKCVISEIKFPDKNCYHYIYEISREENRILENPESLVSTKKSTLNRNNSIEDIASCSTQTFQVIPTDSSKEIIEGSESLLASSVGLDSLEATSNLNQGNLDFGYDEMFCDTCEDFHTTINGLYQSCCKQKKNSSFLKIVFDIKGSSTKIQNSNEDDISEQTIKELNNEDEKLKIQPAVFSKSKRYLAQFKSKVVKYALKHTAKQAANIFKVNRGTVYEWLYERKRSSGVEQSKSSPVQGTTSFDDGEFLSWLDSSKFNLTNELIKNKTAEWLKLSISKSGWLRMYANRLNGTEDSSIKKRYIAYPEAFKRVVVFHAQTHTNMSAARVFGVARRRVVQWQQMFNDARIKPETTTSKNVTSDVVDKALYDWFINQKLPPTSKQVRSKGLELYRAAGYQSIQCGDNWYYRWRARFKLPVASDQLCKEVPVLIWALTQLDNNQSVTHVDLAQACTSLTQSKVSRGWTFRFCRKYHKLLQSIPEPSIVLPLALEQQVVNFRQTLQDTIKMSGYVETDIIAMDEVPLHFLPKETSKKSLLVRRPGFENCQASLIVSSLADGTLLPTMFVYKDQKGASSITSEPCMVPVANDPRLVSDDAMVQWITSICSKQLLGRHGLLITDCFEIHTSKEVQEKLANHQIHQVVVPGGCGFKLLPVTRICQLFKKMLEDMCKRSLANHTAALLSPTPEQMYLWSVRVHKHLAKHQKDNIKTVFKEMLFHPCATSNH